MSAQKARARHDDGVSTVLLQGRVVPTSRQAVNDAAAESKISVSLYLDTLIRHLAENGGLPILSRPKPQAEELPIPAA